MALVIVSMSELNTCTPELGNKIKNLASLAQAGIKVPRGFGLPYSVYEENMELVVPVLEQIRRSHSDFALTAYQMHEEIVSQEFFFEQEVYSALEEYVPGAKYFAVRSSGQPVINSDKVSEDSDTLSLAGQYESFLMVPAENVPKAILHCYASLFSERCLRRFCVDRDGSYLGSRMSVLIQEMYVAEKSGVVMTQDPIEGEKYFGLEATYGACEAIVSGEVQGDLYLLDRKTGAVISSDLGTKTSQIHHQPLTSWESENQVKVTVSNDRRNCFSFTQTLVKNVFDLCMLIEKHFGCPQDIEFVVSGGHIIITQSRPITT